MLRNLGNKYTQIYIKNKLIANKVFISPLKSNFQVKVVRLCSVKKVVFAKFTGKHPCRVSS